MPEPSEQVSIVPPAVPETAPGLEVLAERKALLMWGPASVNLYDAAFRLTAALLRPQLTKLKKRHELLLDSLSDEELVDVVALALYEAPRGLSFIALQTHELVLHYVRNTGPYMRSLRGAVRGVIQSHVAGRAGDGLFTRAPNGNWTLTAEGRHYVDENFRYALQEAAKEKPRRYRIDDFATILHRDRDGYPPLLSVHERRPDTAGALRSVLIEGPVLKTVRRAARDSKSSHVLVVLGAGLDEIELPFGPIFPLLHGDNRGHGALAPTVHLPDAGSVAVPPNLHVVVGLRPGLRPGPALIERYRGIFGTVELPGDGAGAEASDAEPEEG